MRPFAILFSLLGLLCLAAPAHSVTIGIGPPEIDTAIVDGPEEGALAEGEDAIFSFEATRDGADFAGAVFHCSVDGAPAFACNAPAAIGELEEGPHTFSVYAEDPATAAVDPEPAAVTFVVTEAECEDEPRDEAEGDEEGSEAGDEGDEREACEAEDSSGRLPPRECILRSARAKALTGPERIRLTVRYTAFSPASARISYRLGRAGAKLGEERRRLSRRGVLRLGMELGRSEAAKLKTAKRLTVEIAVSDAPSSCRRYASRRLGVRRASHGQALWLQSDSIFGAGA